MNTDTGHIAPLELLESELRHPHPRQRGKQSNGGHGSIGPRTVLRPIDPANLTDRARRQLEATGQTYVSRNSPCPCGSRKRFKRCCMTGGAR